jgi:hypothetical protein
MTMFSGHFTAYERPMKSRDAMLSTLSGRGISPMTLNERRLENGSTS